MFDLIQQASAADPPAGDQQQQQQAASLLRHLECLLQRAELPTAAAAESEQEAAAEEGEAAAAAAAAAEAEAEATGDGLTTGAEKIMVRLEIIRCAKDLREMQEIMQPWVGEGRFAEVSSPIEQATDQEQQGQQVEIQEQEVWPFFRLRFADMWRRHMPVEVAAMRYLLWDLFGQIKPAAAHWYVHGAKQQQQQQPKRKGQHAADVVIDSTSAALWSTLTSSLASDLLLVPPSIRDLVGNAWAAGAGRLQAENHPHDGPSSSSSSGSAAAGAAAKMLAVQYARASRRQYAKVGHAYGQVSPHSVLGLTCLWCLWGPWCVDETCSVCC
jgi:hypothetical protein